jgi:hypothetical protein
MFPRRKCHEGANGQNVATSQTGWYKQEVTDHLVNELTFFVLTRTGLATITFGRLGSPSSHADGEVFFGLAPT